MFVCFCDGKATDFSPIFYSLQMKFSHFIICLYPTALRSVTVNGGHSYSKLSESDCDMRLILECCAMYVRLEFYFCKNEFCRKQSARKKKNSKQGSFFCKEPFIGQLVPSLFIDHTCTLPDYIHSPHKRRQTSSIPCRFLQRENVEEQRDKIESLAELTIRDAGT